MSFVALAGGVGLTAGLSGLVGATAASILAPALMGGLTSAGIGALGSAITGGDAGKGALWGGISGLLGGGLGGFFGGVPAEALAAEESAGLTAANTGAATAANAGLSAGTGAVEGMIPADLAKLGFTAAPAGSEFALSGAAPQLGAVGMGAAGPASTGFMGAGANPLQANIAGTVDRTAASMGQIPTGGGTPYTAVGTPAQTMASQQPININVGAQQAPQASSGVGGFLKDNPLLLPAGMMAVPMLQNMFGPNYSVPQNQPYSGPLSKFKYDPSQYTPTTAVPNVYQPSYAGYAGYADGGITSLDRGAPTPQLMNSGAKPNLNFMDGGSFPMSQQEHMYFNAPTQMPMSAQQTAASYEVKTNPLTGEPVAEFAEGGVAGLSRGALLQGPGDGVSDDIPATIEGKQPAKLSEGEFVVPARIVSELGNGSTDAGAKKLYAMMDRIQKHRGKTMGKKKFSVDSKASRALPA